MPKAQCNSSRTYSDLLADHLVELHKRLVTEHDRLSRRETQELRRQSFENQNLRQQLQLLRASSSSAAGIPDFTDFDSACPPFVHLPNPSVPGFPGSDVERQEYIREEGSSSTSKVSVHLVELADSQKQCGVVLHNSEKVHQPPPAHQHHHLPPMSMMLPPAPSKEAIDSVVSNQSSLHSTRGQQNGAENPWTGDALHGADQLVTVSRTKMKMHSMVCGHNIFDLREEWKKADSELDSSGLRVNNSNSFLSHKAELDGEDVARDECSTETRWFVMSPHSRLRLCWDISGIFVIFYDIMMIPLMAFGTMDSTPLEAMGWFTLAFWSLDMFGSLITGYYRRPGEDEGKVLQAEVLEMRPLMIAKHYFRTAFIMDLFIVGIDWSIVAVTLAGNSEGGLESAGIARVGKLIRILRILRTLRLLRLLKLRTLLLQLQESIDCESISVVAGMTKNVICILVINHVIGCVWYVIGTVDTTMDTWVKAHHMTPEEQTFAYRYTTSLHWSLTQFTPASMHVQPQNLYERIFAVGVVLFAMVVFSSFVSSITSAMTNLRNISGKQAAQFFLLRKYLKQHNIPKELSARLTRYIMLVVAEKKKHVQESNVLLLPLLSFQLRYELQGEMYVKNLTKDHPFFEQVHIQSPNVFHRLCATAISLQALSQSDTLFHHGENANDMFFVKRGDLIYQTPQARSDKASMGSFFCEPALWVYWVHQGDMTAISECDLIAICGNKFREVLSHYTSVMVYATQYSRQFAKALRTEQSDQASVSDLQSLLPKLCHEALNLNCPFVQGGESQLPFKQGRLSNGFLRRSLTRGLA